MTKTETILHLAEDIASLRANLAISCRVRVLQDKLFSEHEERLKELLAERNALVDEAKRVHDAMKRARYALPKKYRDQFDRVFAVSMGGE